MKNSTNQKPLHTSASVWKEAKESNGALQGPQNKKTKSINENPSGPITEQQLKVESI
jgi:hypothetical protein